MNIRKRLPGAFQIAQVYAVIMLMVYGWTLYWYVWKVPSWIYYLTLGELAGVYAYAASVNLLESLLILAGLLLLAFLLPRAWLSDSFAARGTAFLVPLLGYIMVLSNSFKTISEKNYPSALIDWSPAALGIALLLAYLAGKWSPLRRALEEFSARAVIFLYIFVPISAISLAYVFVINLLRSISNG